MEEKKFLTKEYSVNDDNLAINVGSGSLRVLATPSVIAWIENSAAELATEFTEAGVTTVGTKVDIEHISATPINAKVNVTVTLINIDGRKYEFEVSASDDMGLIVKGTHTRFAVFADKFQKKTDTKFGGQN